MTVLTQILAYIMQGAELLLVSYFMISCTYVFVYALAGRMYQKRQDLPYKPSKMAVFIPAYKEDAVIIEVAKASLLQQYPSDCFDIIVIADTLQAKTLKALKDLPIQLIEVNFKNSTKAKALNTAMQRIKKAYEYAIILDADNIMEAQFLQKMNAAFHQGYRVVQGHRKAKNLNTAFAILDAASEAINNHIYRKGHRVLGISSGLIGSGMGFEYDLFKTMMRPIAAVGGFDKELEFELAKRNISIEYLEDAIVLDEKVQKSSDFSKQRRRWLATQFVYLKKYYQLGLKAFVFQGNITFFDKVFQMLVPPRILLLGITSIMTLGYGMLDIIWHKETFISSSYWYINALLLIIAFVAALPHTFYNTSTLKAMLALPSAFFRMLSLLFKLKGANSKFIHTSHGIIKN